MEDVVWLMPESRVEFSSGAWHVRLINTSGPTATESTRLGSPCRYRMKYDTDIHKERSLGTCFGKPVDILEDDSF